MEVQPRCLEASPPTPHSQPCPSGCLGSPGAPEEQAVTSPQARFREARWHSPALPLTECHFSSFLSQEPAGWPWAPCGPCAAHLGPSSVWATAGEGVGRECSPRLPLLCL